MQIKDEDLNYFSRQSEREIIFSINADNDAAKKAYLELSVIHSLKYVEVLLKKINK